MSLLRNLADRPPGLLHGHHLLPVLPLGGQFALEERASLLGSVSGLVDLHEHPAHGCRFLVLDLVLGDVRVVEFVGANGPYSDHVAELLGERDAGLGWVLLGEEEGEEVEGEEGDVTGFTAGFQSQ